VVDIKEVNNGVKITNIDENRTNEILELIALSLFSSIIAMAMVEAKAYIPNPRYPKIVHTIISGIDSTGDFTIFMQYMANTETVYPIAGAKKNPGLFIMYSA
jgi:hypothetical protein